MSGNSLPVAAGLGGGGAGEAPAAAGLAAGLHDAATAACRDRSCRTSHRPAPRPSTRPGRHGALDRQVGPQPPGYSGRAGSARRCRRRTAARRARPACRPASRACCRNCAWPASCTGWSSRAAVTSSLSSFSPATSVVRSDGPTCSGQAGNLRQRCAGVGNLRGDGDIMQRRQVLARRERRQRGEVGHGCGQLQSCSRGLAAAASGCRPRSAWRLQRPWSVCTGQALSDCRSCRRVSGPNSPAKVNGAPL